MREVVGAAGALVVMASALYYIVDVARGSTRPQRTSWLVWALVGALGFGTAHNGGAGPAAYAAAVDAGACVVTFALSLTPRLGKPGGRRTDLALGAVAVAAVVLWRSGALSTTGAAFLAVAIDAVALWPTLREAWCQPQLESLPSWAADVVGNGLCVAAATSFASAALLFPAYLVAACVLVTVVLVVRRSAGFDKINAEFWSVDDHNSALIRGGATT